MTLEPLNIQSTSSNVTIGQGAGFSLDGGTISIGQDAGASGQNSYALAIGNQVGQFNQAGFATAIGAEKAGNLNQGSYATAIGSNAGENNQGEGAVAIGFQAGEISQGANALAIGRKAGYGLISPQPANTIILNASGNDVSGVAGQTGSFYVSPVRAIQVDSNSPFTGLIVGGETFYQSFYNPLTSEFIYVTTSGGPTGPPPPPPDVDALTLGATFTSQALTEATDQLGFYSTARKMSFVVPTTGNYTFTFSGIQGGLYQVISTTTPLTLFADSTAITGLGASVFNSGDSYPLQAGTTIYLLSTGNLDEVLSIIVESVATPPPTQDFITLDNNYSLAPGAINVLTPLSTYTLPFLLAFEVTTTGYYSFTYSGISGSMYNVAITTTASTIYDDSSSLTPQFFVSGQPYQFIGGGTIFLLPEADVATAGFSILVEARDAPTFTIEPLTLGSEFVSSPLTLSVSDGYITPYLLSFLVPTTRRYQFTFSGINAAIYQVLSTTTPTTFVPDSYGLTPPSFVSGNSYDLTAGTTIYMLPLNTLNNSATLTLTIDIEPPIFLTLNVQSISTTGVVSVPTENAGYFTTPYIFAFTPPATDSYVFTYSGIDGYLINVLRESIPSTMYTDSTSLNPNYYQSATPYTLTEGTTIYFMPEDTSGSGSIDIEINLENPPPPPPVDLLVDTELITTKLTTLTSSGTYTLPSVLRFTPLTTGDYTITYTGANQLFQVLSSSTAQTMYTDSESVTPGTFTSGSTYSFNGGTTIYLLPADSTSGVSLTITISAGSSPPPPAPIDLIPDTQVVTTSTLSSPTDGSSFSLPHLLTFTPFTSGEYTFTYTGATSLFKVSSTSTAATMYNDSIQLGSATFLSGTTYTFTAGITTYLLPVSGESGTTLTITIATGSPTPPPELQTLVLGIPLTSSQFDAETSTGNFTTSKIIDFTPSTTGNYIFTFLGSGNLLYKVLRATTPETIYDDSSVQYSSGISYPLTSGVTIYMKPHSPAFDQPPLTIQVDLLVTQVPLNLILNQDVVSQVLDVPTGTGRFTTPHLISFDVPTTGNYKFTFSGINGILYQVLEGTLATDIYDVSDTLPVPVFSDGVPYSFAEGTTIYMMPDSSTNSQTLTIKVEQVITPPPPPATLSLGVAFNAQLSVTTSGNMKTTTGPLAFMVPENGSYSFTYNSLVATLNQVGASTTPESVITDSNEKDPVIFEAGTSYSLGQSQVIYFMPISENLSTTSLSITINLEERHLVQGTTLSGIPIDVLVPANQKLTTPYTISFNPPTTGAYTFTFSGLYQSGLLYKVLETTTPSTFLTDTQSTNPQTFLSGVKYNLQQGNIIYLMPADDVSGTFEISVAFNEPVLPVPLTLGTAFTSEALEEQTGLPGKRATSYVMSIDIPYTAKYLISYTGNVALYNVLETTVSTSMYDDSLTKTPPSFDSGTIYTLSTGMYYLIPDTSNSGETITITITAEEVPLSLNTTFSTDELTGVIDTGTRTTPFVLSFTPSSDGIYYFLINGLDTIYQVNNNTDGNSMYADSANKPYPTFVNEIRYSLTGGQPIYMLPEAILSVFQGTFTFEIRQVQTENIELILGDQISPIQPLSVALPTGTMFGKYTSPYILNFTPTSDGNYTFTFSGASEGLYVVSSTTTAMTFPDPTEILTSGVGRFYTASEGTIYLMPVDNAIDSTLTINVNIT